MTVTFDGSYARESTGSARREETGSVRFLSVPDFLKTHRFTGSVRFLSVSDFSKIHRFRLVPELNGSVRFGRLDSISYSSLCVCLLASMRLKMRRRPFSSARRAPQRPYVRDRRTRAYTHTHIHSVLLWQC